jgi:hypothetical protein
VCVCVCVCVNLCLIYIVPYGLPVCPFVQVGWYEFGRCEFGSLFEVILVSMSVWWGPMG